MKKLKGNQKRIIYLVELLILLGLVLSGLAKQPETVFQAQPPKQTDAAWQSESFALSPGIYEIIMEAELPADSSLTLSAVNQVPGIFRELLANELTMQSGEATLSGRITVTAALEQVCLQIAGSGNASEATVKKITVERTGQWNLVLAVCFLIGITLVNLLWYLRQRIAQERISGEQQLVLWGLAAAIVAAVFPGLTDYITVSGDTMWYLSRMEALAEGELSLQAGSIYLTIPAFFRIVGFTVQTSWQLFLWGFTILTAVSSYYYLWLCIRDRKSSLLITVLLLLNPWRASLCYSTGNISGWLGLNLLVLPVGVLLIALQKKAGLGVLRKVLSVLAVIAVSLTFYQLNDLVFHLEPRYLYELGVWGWENQVRMQEMSRFTDLAADAAVLMAVILLAIAVFRRVRKGGKHHESM